jgi:hypothetical protein
MRKLSHRFTIFFGDTDDTVSVAAQKFDPDAFLVNTDNLEQVINTGLVHDVAVYTSLGDLPKDLIVVCQLLEQADDIFYCPPEIWSDHAAVDVLTPTDSMQGLTENILLLLCHQVKVHGIEQALFYPKAVPLTDHRKTASPQMWSVGCSITHGDGVDNSSRYGQLIASELDLECSFLTRPGSSITWAADQILRSDVKSNDIVVWGITNNERVSYVHQGQLLPGICIGTYQTYPKLKQLVPIETLLTENTLYQNIYSIEQVINFCNKCQARLLMIGLLPNYNILRYLSTKFNFFNFPYPFNFSKSAIKLSFVDVGTDNEHPGPLQHSLYKNFVLKHI